MAIYPFYLGKEIARPLIKLLLEATQPVAILPGRFQPFHRGHYEAYKYLVDKFGPDRVYIATSDKTEPGRSPFNFAEKQQIITKMFGIDPSRVVQTVSPYKPVEITSQLPPGTPVILGMGEKDASRMKGFASQPGDVSQMQGYDTPYGNTASPTIYSMTVPMVSGEDDVSGERARQVFASGDQAAIQTLFQQMYGKADPELMAMVTGKVAQSSQQAAAVAAEKQRKAAAPKANQFYQDRITNPITQNDISIQSALASKDPQVHQAAKSYLKGKGVLVENILLEGGAFGHMLHPYEDMELTFGDLKELVTRSLITGIEGPVSEKVDGQNIMMSFIDGHTRFALKKTETYNKGQTALNVDGVRTKFSDRPHLARSFGEAAADLDRAISGLSIHEQEKMFGNGTKFMNVEILHPGAENIIPYGKNLLVLHQTMEFDPNGNQIGIDSEGGEYLASVLKKQNAEKQQEYDIRGRQPLQVMSDGESDRAKEKADEYIAEIDGIKNQYGLTDEQTLGDYKRRAWGEILDDSKIPLTPEEREGLVRRWADGNKAFLIRKLPKEYQEWASEVDKKSTTINGDFMSPVQMCVARLGADTILRSNELLASQNPEAAKKITDKLNDAIRTIRASDDLDAQEKIEYLLRTVDAIGLDKLAPTEGIVFSYKGKLLKYTGLFAPINRIINTLKMARSDSKIAQFVAKQNQAKQAQQVAQPPEPVQAPQAAPAPQPSAPVAPPKSADDAALAGIDPAILNQTIRNPETQNQILVRSALKYPENHPAYRAARQMVDKQRG